MTLFGEDSYDGVERENVWIVETVKDTESNMRRVVTNETGSYEIVLMSAELEDACMDLEKMRTRNVAL